MSGIRRPKTAGAFPKRQEPQPMDGGQPMLTAATVGRLPRRPGSQMSLRSAGLAQAADESCWPQYVPIRRVPSAMKRNIEIQTDSNLPPQPAGASFGVSSGQGPADEQQPAISGGALFYPYYVPGLQDSTTAGRQQPQAQQQPFVLLSPWQLPGYQSLPVLDASQLRLLDPALRRPAEFHPLDGAPIYRSGRNGSCWRHIRQCTGNLGNNIMFVDGHVKEEDCRRFPPHGFPSASTGGLSVYSRLAPKSQPRQQLAAGIPELGFPSRQPAGAVGLSQTRAQERAKSGAKFWFEDRKPAKLVPNTIQGRIMKSGSAY